MILFPTNIYGNGDRVAVSHQAIEQYASEHSVFYKVDALAYSTVCCSDAQLVVCPDIEQVKPLLSCLREESVEYQPLGCASNTLLNGTRENPISTVLVSTANLRGLTMEGTVITVEAGTRMSTLSRFAAEHGLTGLEFACDIPGTVAGAIATDAWHPIHDYASLFEQAGIEFEGVPMHVRSVLISADVLGPDGEVIAMTPADLAMANRTSLLTRSDNERFLLRARFDLQPGDPESIWGIRNVVHLGRQAMRAANREVNPYSVGKTLGYSFVVKHPTYGGVSAKVLIAQAPSLPNEIEIDGM
jgi:UDP-N-acetylenolpyruvoylglucosamine reductase